MSAGDGNVRNWIDCIFIATLCDGGGKGSRISIPFSAFGAHTISVTKTLYNVKIHHLQLKIFRHQGQPNTLPIKGWARSAGSHDFLWGHQEALWTAAWLFNDGQLARIIVPMCPLSLQLENLPSMSKPTSFPILLRGVILFLGCPKKWMHEWACVRGHKTSYKLTSNSSY